MNLRRPVVEPPADQPLHPRPRNAALSRRPAPFSLLASLSLPSRAKEPRRQPLPLSLCSRSPQSPARDATPLTRVSLSLPSRANEPHRQRSSQCHRPQWVCRHCCARLVVSSNPLFSPCHVRVWLTVGIVRRLNPRVVIERN